MQSNPIQSITMTKTSVPYMVLSVYVYASLTTNGTSHSFTKHSTRCVAFAPCPPPRFDVFSEPLIGSWTNDEDEQRSLEEVMRSCGGAVQGIREPFGGSASDDDGDGVYLNRANDGFVFVDNGCYSFGPVQWNAKEEDFFLSNIQLGAESRLVLSSSSSSSSKTIQNTDPMVLRKTHGGGTSSIQVVVETDPTSSLSVDFGKIIQCSMGGSSLGPQPWMLQRAKWEREPRIVRTSTTSEEEEEDPSSFSDSIRCWVVSQSASDFFRWAAAFTGNKDERTAATTTEGLVLHMGALCEGTGRVKAMSRHYNPSHVLTKVMFLEGRLDE
jgi:hypothetical protein